MSEGPQQEAGLRDRTEEETEHLKSLYVYGEESVAAIARREGMNHKTLQQHAYRHKWREARTEYRNKLARTRGQGVIEPMTAVQRINLEIARKVMQYFQEDLELRVQNNTVYEFPFEFFKQITSLLRDTVKGWGGIMPIDEKITLQQFNQVNVSGDPNSPGTGGTNKVPIDPAGMKEFMRTLANSIASGSSKPPEIPVQVVVPRDGEQ